MVLITSGSAINLVTSPSLRCPKQSFQMKLLKASLQRQRQNINDRTLNKSESLNQTNERE